MKKAFKSNPGTIFVFSIVLVGFACIGLSCEKDKAEHPPIDDSKWAEWGLKPELAIQYKEVREERFKSRTEVTRIVQWISIPKGEYEKEQLKATSVRALKELYAHKTADEYGVFVIYEGYGYKTSVKLVKAYLAPSGEWSNIKEGRDWSTYAVGFKFLE